MDYLLQIVLMAGLMMIGSQACTDFKEYGSRNSKDEARKVYYSEVILFGQIAKKHVKGDFPYSDLDGVFTSGVTVYCVFKGENVSKTINVVGMGNRYNKLEGCPKVPAKVGQSMIFFLSRTNIPDTYELEYAPGEADLVDQIDEITISCGAKIEIKEHEGEEHEENINTCEDASLLEEDCYQYEKPTPPPTTQAPTVKEESAEVEVKVEPEPEEEQGDGKYNTDNNSNKQVTKTGEVSGDGSNGGAVFVSSLLLIISAAMVTLV